MKYVLYGNPVPLARARTSYVARRCYDSQKTLKLIAAIEIQRQHDDRPFYEGPLSLDVTFYLPLAKSMSRRKSDKFVNTPHSIRPDCSNLIKYIEDAIQSVVYKNDSQIAVITARKVYSLEPKTIFTIEEIK